MALAKIVGAQRDFSAGELDVAMKRADDHPIMKIGARQLSNFRILNSGAAINRPGRSALFVETGRVDEILMAPGQIFYLVFGNGYLRVYNAAGTQVFNTTKLGDGSTNIPWTTATVKNIVFVIAPQPQFNVYITYADGAPANVPQILGWDGVSQSSTWTLSTYAETITAGAQKRTPFYRLSAQNISIHPSATTGSVTLVASSPVFVAGMVGTRLRYATKQLLITAFTSTTKVTATVEEPLPFAEVITPTGTVSGTFNVGDVILGATSGAKAIVIATSTIQTVNFSIAPVFAVGDFVSGGTSGATGVVNSTGATSIVVSLVSGTLFVGTEVLTAIYTGATQTSTTVSGTSGGSLIVQVIPNATGNTIYFSGGASGEAISGPSGSASSTNIITGTVGPQAISVWDDEVMNAFRGYPKSVFFDQSRLGFTNFPALPSGIVWSAIGLPTDLYTGAIPSQSIFELVPGKSQVQFVQPGLEGSEFVFCDNAISYIPISPANPLVPGSVAFNQISSEGSQPNVQPRQANQSIVYMKAGGLKVGAVQVPGTYYRPYVIDDVSEYHGHLFTPSPVIAIAIPSAANQFEELYAYILFANGSLAIGKYQLKNGLLDVGPDGKPKIGWLPWKGRGTTTWVSAQSADVILTSSYSPNAVTPVSVVERVDNTQYVDGALLVNSLPAPFTPPGGRGPLFVFPGPGGAVTLMDNSTRMMGVYQVNANGFIIPQGNAGENLSSANLVAGHDWTATLEPFVPEAQPGQDIHQRMFPRRVSRMAIYVSQSTGFLMARFFSGPLTRTSPPLGTIMNSRRVATWNQDDDPTQPPPLREETQRWRPLGRAYDPRVGVIKDTPGPVIVHEIGMEATV